MKCIRPENDMSQRIDPLTQNLEVLRLFGLKLLLADVALVFVGKRVSIPIPDKAFRKGRNFVLERTDCDINALTNAFVVALTAPHCAEPLLIHDSHNILHTLVNHNEGSRRVKLTGTFIRPLEAGVAHITIENALISAFYASHGYALFLG